jgi:hypothetical protein
MLGQDAIASLPLSSVGEPTISGSSLVFTLIDNYNRALIGSDWTASVDPGDVAGQIASNQYSGAGASSYHSDWYNVATQADAVGIAVDLSTLSDTVWLCARISSPGTSGVDGYLLIVESDGSARIERVNNVAYTVLASYAAGTFSAGDSFALIPSGTGSTVALDVYRYRSGSWSSVGTYNDSSADRITSLGYGGLGLYGSSSRLDNFGTLELVSGGPVDYPRAQSISVAHSASLARASALARPQSILIAHSASVAALSSKPRALSSTIAQSATLARSAARARSQSSSVASSASLSRSTSASRMLSSTIAQSASLARLAARARALSISLSHSASVSRAAVLARALTSSVGASASVSRLAARARALSISLAHSASVSRAAGLARSLTISVASVASVARLVSGGSTDFPRSLASTIAHSASIARAAASSRVLASTVAVSASVSRAGALARVLASTIAQSASLARVAARARALASTVAHTASVARVAARARALASSAAHSAAVSRAVQVARVLASTIAHAAIVARDVVSSSFVPPTRSRARLDRVGGESGRRSSTIARSSSTQSRRGNRVRR